MSQTEAWERSRRLVRHEAWARGIWPVHPTVIADLYTQDLHNA